MENLMMILIFFGVASEQRTLALTLRMQVSHMKPGVLYFPEWLRRQGNYANRSEDLCKMPRIVSFAEPDRLKNFMFENDLRSHIT